MKKIFIIFLISISFFSVSYAEDWKKGYTATKTTSKIPWVSCVENEWWKTKTYTCYVPQSTDWILETLGWIIRYFTYIVWITWVLFIVVNGILYSMWWLDQELKETAKKRIVKTIVWLIILLSSWYILQTIAPWVYK